MLPTGWSPGSFLSSVLAFLTLLHLLQDDSPCGVCSPNFVTQTELRAPAWPVRQGQGVGLCWDPGQSPLVSKGTLISNQGRSTQFSYDVELTHGIRKREAKALTGLIYHSVFTTEGLWGLSPPPPSPSEWQKNTVYWIITVHCPLGWSISTFYFQFLQQFHEKARQWRSEMASNLSQVSQLIKYRARTWLGDGTLGSFYHIKLIFHLQIVKCIIKLLHEFSWHIPCAIPFLRFPPEMSVLDDVLISHNFLRTNP